MTAWLPACSSCTCLLVHAHRTCCIRLRPPGREDSFLQHTFLRSHPDAHEQQSNSEPRSFRRLHLHAACVRRPWNACCNVCVLVTDSWCSFLLLPTFASCPVDPARVSRCPHHPASPSPPLPCLPQVDKQAVSPFVPRLLRALVMCFKDASWPVGGAGRREVRCRASICQEACASQCQAAAQPH